MSDSTSERSPREQQLDAIIADYYLAAEQGQPFAQATILAQHSDFSAELREFFADDGRVRSVVRPFSSNESPTLAKPGHQIGGYRILNKIGEGGMGAVYLALQMRLEKTVALKILKADWERDSNAIPRFEREMKAVGKLVHPHIVLALYAGEESGTHFLAMEYLDGCDLGHLLKTKGRLEVPLACELIRQAALGLQYAHDHKLVHRDVKPSNLMLSTDGQVKVLDLGLAQLQASVGETNELTREGHFVGTWRYMPPEQFLPGRQVDSRSDIFSLGVTFYSLLVGDLPLSPGQAGTDLPTIVTHRADVPPDLQILLSKMLAPKQDERIQTMTEVASVLQTYSMQGSVSIDAIKAHLASPVHGLPSANDCTRRCSSTADELEIIPPPVQAAAPESATNFPRVTGLSNNCHIGIKEGGVRWLTRGAWYAICLAVVSMMVIGGAYLSKTQQRKQAGVRFANLPQEIAQDLENGDLESAKSHLDEMGTLLAKYPDLADADAVREWRARIQGYVDERRREVEKINWQSHPEKHGILGLIPQDAIGAVGVASIDQVRKSIKDTAGAIRGEKTPPIFSPEGVVKAVLMSPPFECYQQDEPLALVFANPVKAGVKLPDNTLDTLTTFNPLEAMLETSPLLESLGVVVGTPIDVRQVEQKLDLAEGSLVTGSLHHSKLNFFAGLKEISILMRDDRLYVGFTDRSVLAVADSLKEQKSVAMDMDPREAARLTSMDLLLHFGPGAWRQEWESIADLIRDRLAADNNDRDAVEMADEFAAIMRLAKTFLLGVKLDKGLQVSLLVLLSPHEDARLEHFADLIGRGEEPLTLAGLPHDGAIGAFATRGNGLSNAVIAQSLLLLLKEPSLASGLQIPAEKRPTLSSAFRDVWNQVEGTRAGTYFGADAEKAPTIVVLDIDDPKTFINRLKELVSAWEDVSPKPAEGDDRQPNYRFAMPEEDFDGREAFRLSLSYQGAAGVINEKLWIVPVGKQMVLSFGDDNSPLRQVIKNITSETPRPGLAEHPAIMKSAQRLPATRKMELHLWLSEIKRFTEGAQFIGNGPAEYSSASLTLGETSLGLDVWIPLVEIDKLTFPQF